MAAYSSADEIGEVSIDAVLEELQNGPRVSYLGPRFPANYLTQKRKRVEDYERPLEERRQILKAKYDPAALDFGNLYAVHCWMEYMAQDVWRGKAYFSDGDAFATWLWNARREHHLALAPMDESGAFQGWTALARLLILECRVRAGFATTPIFYATDRALQKLGELGLLHTKRSVKDYDRLDILFAFRLLARNFSTECAWRSGIKGLFRVLEVFLHDLNLRAQAFVNDDSGQHDRDFVVEVTHMTAVFHQIMYFWNSHLARAVIAPAVCKNYKHGLIAESRLRQIRDQVASVYEKCYDNVREFLRAEFLQVARMGIISRRVVAALRKLLMPLDVLLRYRLEVNRVTTDLLIASETVLSRCETNFLDFEMCNFSDQALLEAGEIDAEEAWLFETCSIVKLFDDIMCQFNVDYRWAGNTVLYARDAHKCRPETVLLNRTPVLLVYGTHVIFVYRKCALPVRDLYEGIMLWTFVVDDVYGGMVPVGDDAVFDVKREISRVMDICFAGVEALERADLALLEADPLSDPDSGGESAADDEGSLPDPQNEGSGLESEVELELDNLLGHGARGAQHLRVFGGDGRIATACQPGAAGEVEHDQHGVGAGAALH